MRAIKKQNREAHHRKGLAFPATFLCHQAEFFLQLHVLSRALQRVCHMAWGSLELNVCTEVGVGWMQSNRGHRSTERDLPWQTEKKCCTRCSQTFDSVEAKHKFLLKRLDSQCEEHGKSERATSYSPKSQHSWCRLLLNFFIEVEKRRPKYTAIS